MSRLGLSILMVVLAAASIRAQIEDVVTRAPAEQKILEAIESPDLTVVHLWAPWCPIVRPN